MKGGSIGGQFGVYAVRYATREVRSGENFHSYDPHDAPMPLDYFVP